ncbi:hypothetical protein B7486_62570, partial [cyanobacterium TDX16]
MPHEWFTWMRANQPVFHHPEPDGPGFWVITKHADIKTCSRDAGTFSSAAERGGVIGIEEREGDEATAAMAGNLLIFMDPPRHTRYRKLVNRGFTPRMIGMLEPRIRELTNAMLDTALTKDPCDFVVDIAAELPLEVICELIGVPSEDRHKIFDWSNRLVGGEDPEYAVSEDDRMNAQLELFAYAQGLAEQHRGAGEDRDDIISKLLAAEPDGEALSELDFNLFVLLLSVAGNETTRNAIAHGMNAFLENPDQWELLVSDPSLIGTATEEILRWASPVMYFRRNVTQDVQLGDVTLREGDKITLWYSSANRDEDVFDDPFRF